MEKDYVELIPREIREAHWPRARFLSDDEQLRYEEAVKGFNLERARLSLNVSQNGSNLFKVILLNQLGIRTATIPELYNVFDTNPDFLSGHYEDVASVVLRSAKDSHTPNNLLAKKLVKSIGKANFKNSYVLSGLKLKEDKDSEYGLVLFPGENFEYFHAPEFDHSNDQKRFSRVSERGVPVLLADDEISRLNDKDKERLKTLYTRNEGLSRLCVDRGSGLGAGGGVLSGSGSVGRVVVVDAEGVAPKNLELYIANLEIERAKQESDLNKRYDDAMALLKGNKR